MVHFNAATLKVRDLNEFVTMSALKQGLQNGHLNFLSDKNFSRSYAKFLERARKYIQTEEGQFLHWKEGKKGRKKKWPYKE